MSSSSSSSSSNSSSRSSRVEDQEDVVGDAGGFFVLDRIRRKERKRLGERLKLRKEEGGLGGDVEVVDKSRRVH